MKVEEIASQANHTYDVNNDWELEASVQIPIIWESIW